MTIVPFPTVLAKEQLRVLMQNADDYRLAKAARMTRTRRASRLTLRVRLIRPDDAAVLTDIFARLSSESRLARFLYPKTALSDAELRYLSDVDHRHHEALIAVTRFHGDPVGVARFIRNDGDPATAEIAFAIVDEWQNRGVGSMLATRLAQRALRENISHFTALTAAGNLRARRLLGKLGDVRVVRREGPTVFYRVALAGPAPVSHRPRGVSLVPASGT